MAYFPPINSSQTFNICASSPMPVASSLGIGPLSYTPTLTATYTKIGTPINGAKAVRMYLKSGDAITFTINNSDIPNITAANNYYAPEFQYTMDGNVLNNIPGKSTVYDLTANGTINYVPGVVGTAMGSGMFANNTALVATISAYPEFTVELWAKPSPANYGNLGVMIGQNTAFWIGVNSNGGCTYALGQAPLQTVINTPQNTLNDGNWHHIAATNSVSAGCKLFIDGILSASAPGNLDSYGAVWNQTLDISNFGGAYHYFGYIDNIAIFNFLKYTTTFTISTSSYATTDNFTPQLGPTNIPKYTISFDNTGPNWDEQLSNNNNVYIYGISGSPLYRWI